MMAPSPYEVGWAHDNLWRCHRTGPVHVRLCGLHMEEVRRTPSVQKNEIYVSMIFTSLISTSSSIPISPATEVQVAFWRNRWRFLPNRPGSLALHMSVATPIYSTCTRPEWNQISLSWVLFYGGNKWKFVNFANTHFFNPSSVYDVYCYHHKQKFTV